MTKVTHVISVPLVPRDAIAALELRAALDEMCAADPLLGVETGPVNEIIVKGMGELHLEIVIDRLQRERDLTFKIGAPQVAYREKITKAIEWDYTHAKRASQYAKVKIRFAPGEPDSGFRFENALRGDVVPPAFVPAIEKALIHAKETGVIAGFPVIDLKCTLIDGGYHDVDSSAMTFDIAARACFREALPKCGPKLLEPIMKVEVVTPREYMGDVIGDLNSRRGLVQGMDSRGDAQVISALVPLANLFGYIISLRSMTRGRASYLMTFSHYAEMPGPGPFGDDNFPQAAAMRQRPAS